MTVKQLIDNLSKLPGDLVVVSPTYQDCDGVMINDEVTDATVSVRLMGRYAETLGKDVVVIR